MGAGKPVRAAELHRGAAETTVDAHFDQVINGGILDSVVSDFLDKLGVDAVNAHGNQIVR
jgi:hypothetical protein